MTAQKMLCSGRRGRGEQFSISGLSRHEMAILRASLLYDPAVAERNRRLIEHIEAVLLPLWDSDMCRLLTPAELAAAEASESGRIPHDFDHPHCRHTRPSGSTAR
jgi:hypothetical protein